MQNDKNSIVQTASKSILELQRFREELKKRKSEFEGNLVVGNKTENTGETQIKIKVGNPTSGVDSMLQVLKCLNNMNSKLTTIQANFSPHQLSAVINIETQVITHAYIYTYTVLIH